MSQIKKENNFEKMTTWPISKLVITLGIPTTISMLVTNIYNMADTFFVSELGNSASGAVGVVFGLMAIIQAFGFMFGHGAGSIIARKLGQRDERSAGVFASLSIAACLVTGAIIGVFGLLFLKPLMRVLGSTGTILPYAVGYGKYILIVAPITMSSFALNNILRYEGKAFFAMIGLTVGGVLNIVLDPILIFGLGMGIDGAGLSTALSQIVSFFILLSMFIRGKTQSKLSISLVKENPKGIFLIMATGFPSLARQGLNSISTMILNNLAGGFGDAAVAAMSIVNRITFFIFAVGLGIGQGFQPVASFNYGAKLYQRVKKAFYFTFGAGEVLLGIFAIVGMIFSGGLIGIFRDDPTVIQIGTPALRYQLAALFFQPLSICSNMLFQSIGENKKATFLSMLRSGILFIPTILILTWTFGLFGVQVSQAIADVLAFVVTLPLVVSFLKKLPQDAPEIKKETIKMNEIYESILTRRSVKKYKDTPVSAELVEKVATAGTYAPSGLNKQPCIILAITNKEKRDYLSSLNAKVRGAEGTDPFYGAPAVLVVLANRDESWMGTYDGSLVMENMLLAAHSLGLGACWIHRAKEVFETEEGKEFLKELGIEGDYEGIGNCIIGYADGEYPKLKPRKENYVYYVK